jgi:RNA polymerase sigma factor (sigma-70 family)
MMRFTGGHLTRPSELGDRRKRAEDEFSWFFSAEYEAVTRTVFFIIHDAQRAEDIAQDAFMQLLVHWKKVSKYERPDAWIRRVAIRQAMRHVRRERIRPTLEREVVLPRALQTADVDVLKAVAKLPTMQRAAVVLFYFEDRPMEEIADALGCSTSTGWVHLHRARKRLAEMLGEEMTSNVD